MIHLRKFNELKRNTYIDSASELKKLGHEIRSFRMMIHSERQEFKDFGKVNLDYEKINGDFYIGLKLNHIKIYDNMSWGNEPITTHLGLNFDILLIPATKKEEDHYIELIKIKKKSDDPYVNMNIIEYEYKLEDLINGGITILYDISDSLNDDPIKFRTMYSYTNPKFKKNRRFAVLLKKQLLSCFSPGEYPSTNKDFSSMHDEIRDKLENELNLTLEYDYSIEDIYNDIKNFSLNKLYSE
jgi:hypothetical protein